VNDRPTTTPSGKGPWRVLILDRNPADPKWLVATVSLSLDVRMAVVEADGRYQDWPEVVRWVSEVSGQDVELIPVTDALCWHVDERRPPR
jgi:hypothetical protein